MNEPLMLEAATDFLFWPYKIRVTSEFGTALAKICSYCRETFGPQGNRWNIESYMWEYEMYFKHESDYMLFMLKYK